MLGNDLTPTFHTLVDLFLTRYRDQPERCSVEAFANEHPQMREVILAEFPAVLAIEQLHSQLVTVEKIPTQIGRYLVGREIGRGGMGIVFSARHPDLDNEVAIKLLPFRRMRSTSALKRFHAEARACAAMDHPNIVPVYDYGTESDFAYLVMRRVNGGSLDKLISGSANSSPFGDNILGNWRFIAQLGGQVAGALQYAHDNGIIHRDIKPANIILDADGKAWVSDFGLAKIRRGDVSLSSTDDVVGTPRYMAPEQLRGVYDARNDVYGLGVSLYELASGARVWDTLETSQLLRKRMTLELPDVRELNPNIPVALGRIIMRAVALEPDDRYQTAGEFNYVLNRFTHGNPVADRRSYRIGERRLWYRKKILASLAGFLLFAVCSGAYGIYQYAIGKQSFRDPESLLRVFDQETTRRQFVEELPELIRTLTVNDRRALREVTVDLARKAIDSSVLKFEGNEKTKMDFISRFDQFAQAFESSGYDGEESAAQVHQLATEMKFPVEKLNRALLTSSLAPGEKVEALRHLLHYHELDAPNRAAAAAGVVSRLSPSTLCWLNEGNASESLSESELRDIVNALTAEFSVVTNLE